MAAGAQYAVLAGSNATPTAAQSAMTNATALAGVTFTASAPACLCINTAHVLSSQTCGVACPDGTLPGTYTYLHASYTYQPITPGISNMLATTITASAWARLQ